MQMTDKGTGTQISWYQMMDQYGRSGTHCLFRGADSSLLLKNRL